MMDIEDGDPKFPIWLIGDSNPVNWQNKIQKPFDSIHPIRHNIWTSVADVIQDNVYRKDKLRVDTSHLFIRNAIENPDLKPKPSDIVWNDYLNNEIFLLKNHLLAFNPSLVFTFGAFAYEFVRRTDESVLPYQFSHWGAHLLGEEFRHRITHFSITKTNIIPLLHRSIAGGKFLQSHEYFCANYDTNYFNFVGNEISHILLQEKEKLEVWITC